MGSQSQAQLSNWTTTTACVYLCLLSFISITSTPHNQPGPALSIGKNDQLVTKFNSILFIDDMCCAFTHAWKLGFTKDANILLLLHWTGNLLEKWTDKLCFISVKLTGFTKQEFLKQPMAKDQFLFCFPQCILYRYNIKIQNSSYGYCDNIRLPPVSKSLCSISVFYPCKWAANSLQNSLLLQTTVCVAFS